MKTNYSIYSIQKRLLTLIVLVTLIFSALFVRLGYLQIINASWLQHMAEDQWTRDLPIASQRGTIYDTNDVALAVSYSSYNVYVRASNVKDAGEVAQLLSSTLGIDYHYAYEKAIDRGISETLIKMQIEKEQANVIKKANLKGIYLSENTKRFYPYDELMTQVMGYTTIDNSGQAGIELFYDKYLKGINGYSMVQSDITGTELDEMLSAYVSSIPGADVGLTIDFRIQMMLEEALNKVMLEQMPNTATGIIMNPKTGEIIAMSSKPSFNLNEPPRDDIASFMRQSKNLSIVDVYEPGSTFKVLTMAAILEEELGEYTDSFYCPGYTHVDGQKIRCWKSHGHGSQNLIDGFNNSCNVVFVELALRLGTKKFYEYFDKYGFGQKSNVDFPAESSGLLIDPALVKNMDLARMGFGQAIAVTPLQQITAICSVLNGGNLMQPYFVNSITSPYGDKIKQIKPTIVGKTISEETSERIRFMLEEVVTNNSGKYAFIPGYAVSGKTGTTIKYIDGKTSDKYISSFVGAFPANNPEYVILIVADEPKAGAFFGSIVAAPYAKEVLQGIIEYKNIPPVNLEEDLKLVEQNIKMPSLIGKSLAEACGMLANLNLQYEVVGEGGIVIAQTPPPGEFVFERAIVILKTWKY